MPTPVPSEYKHHSRCKRNFGALYGAVVLLSLHWAVVVYINSSFLSNYISDSAIGILYTVSSAVTVLAFLFISRVLHRAGNYKLTLVCALLEFGALIGMAMTDSLRVAIPLFMLHQAVVPLIIFNLDIYMEEMIGDQEFSTGGRRGLFLAIMSFAGALSPLVSGFLIGDSSEPQFALAYTASALILIPFIFIMMRYFRSFADPVYSEIKVLPALRSFWIKKDIRNVFFAHFLLQLFFVWTVIYMPLYLASYIGFDWEEIGLILFVGLMAYVIFEYPIGIIADKWLGEKEMMAVGFVIIGVAVSWFAFIDSASIGLWMFAMFMTRVGAILVETTTESYFFKHTKGTDSNIISFFRITRPLSFVVGALFGSLALLYFPFSFLFILIGFLMIPGLFFTMALMDTK
jgi:MFS family permease